VKALWICAAIAVLLRPVVLDAKAAARQQPHRRFEATAYSKKGKTATGTRTRRGVVAADPRVLPPGSVVHVKGAGPYSGKYKVSDTGGSVKGHKIDIYVPNQKSARKFGRKKVRVKVVKRGGQPR
jgi:3D (Asp-Asp-Asp) domain-containing protein